MDATELSKQLQKIQALTPSFYAQMRRGAINVLRAETDLNDDQIAAILADDDVKTAIASAAYVMDSVVMAAALPEVPKQDPDAEPARMNTDTIKLKHLIRTEE